MIGNRAGDAPLGTLLWDALSGEAPFGEAPCIHEVQRSASVDPRQLCGTLELLSHPIRVGFRLLRLPKVVLGITFLGRNLNLK